MNHEDFIKLYKIQDLCEFKQWVLFKMYNAGETDMWSLVNWVRHLDL